MEQVISIIGPAGAGKSAFCEWFLERNPMFNHLDIAKFRQDNEIGEAKDIDDQIMRNELAWADLWAELEDSDYVLLETTGLDYRLQSIYNKYCGITCVVKLLQNKEILVERLKERDLTEKQLAVELQAIESDLSRLESTKADIVIQNFDELDYEKLEDKIFIFLAETFSREPRD